MAVPQLKKAESFTYADYLTWPDDERWELIDGEAYDMSPGPGMRHQRIVTHLGAKLYAHLEGKPCQAFVAPFDVRPLASADMSDDEVDTVVQPDLLVVCDKTKLEERGVIGAPDLVVEILSPYTARKDLTRKFELYERVGVREYWVVYPDEKIIQVYRHEDGRYGQQHAVGPGDVLEVPWLDELELDVAAVFAEYSA
jgi:Uma2 family endonuclease